VSKNIQVFFINKFLETDVKTMLIPEDEWVWIRKDTLFFSRFGTDCWYSGQDIRGGISISLVDFVNQFNDINK